MFAPTDAAFRNLQSQNGNSALLNMELKKLIEYHVSTSSGYEKFISLLPPGTLSLSTLCTSCGSLSVQASPSGALQINGKANALKTIQTCNGAIVLVDSLLIPQSGSQTTGPENTVGDSPECSPQDPMCCDLPPPEYSCSQQKIWGKCDEQWMVLGNGNGGFCKYTCGRCGSQSSAPPPSSSPTFPPQTSPSPSPSFDSDFEDYNNGDYYNEDNFAPNSPTFGRPPRSPIDPRASCQCTRNGRSGTVDTGRRGCFRVNAAAQYAESIGESFGRRAGEYVSRMFGGDSSGYSSYFGSLWRRAAGSFARQNFRNSRTDICYVVEPQGCAAARESTIFPGAAWRSCERN